MSVLTSKRLKCWGLACALVRGTRWTLAVSVDTTHVQVHCAGQKEQQNVMRPRTRARVCECVCVYTFLYMSYFAFVVFYSLFQAVVRFNKWFWILISSKRGFYFMCMPVCLFICVQCLRAWRGCQLQELELSQDMGAGVEKQVLSAAEPYL